MPNKKAASKHMRQTRVRSKHNRSVRSELRTLSRKVMTAAEAGKIEEAEAGYRVASKRLDQAASKNVIHKNAASRKKSRLSHAIVKAKSAGK